MAPVEQGDVADALDDLRGSRLGERIHDSIATGAIGSPDLHLDQLVVPEREIAFADDAFGRAGVSHEDDRFQVVSQASERFSLCVAERHCPAVYQHRGAQ
jgi:hypothetical protein